MKRTLGLVMTLVGAWGCAPPPQVCTPYYEARACVPAVRDACVCTGVPYAVCAVNPTGIRYCDGAGQWTRCYGTWLLNGAEVECAR